MINTEILNRLYLTTDDICELIPISKKEARRICKEIVNEMELAGEPVFKFKGYLVPTKRVRKKLMI